MRVFVLMAVMLLGACEDKAPPPDPKAHADGLYLHGTALYLKGELDEAFKVFEQVKQLQPQDPRLPAAFGEVRLAQGNLKDALTFFHDAAAKEPRRSTNWSRIGFIQTQLGNVDEARSALRKAVALNSKDHVALEAMGELDFREGKLDAAISHWRLSAEVSPTVDQASELYVRAARELVKAERTADALALLQKPAASGEATPLVLAEYAELLVRQKRFEEALEAYVAAAKRSPNDPGLWELAGELYLALDKPADAIAAFRESLKIKDRAVVHLALARIHQARNEPQAAQEELQRALDTATGEETRESHELARVLAEVGRREDALKILQMLSEEAEHARDVELQVETAKLARELGNKQLAGEACTRAIAADPKLKCP